ncbi:MAG: uncharacterized protein JWP97_6560 [Labilithrix sp.]|nr:uncharacterized protein [Labilithrix sp.]
MAAASTPVSTGSSRPEEAPPRGSRWLRLGLRAAAVGVALTGVIGALHMPFAAPLLRAISPSFVCPIQRGTAAQIDRAHALGAGNIRSSASAVAPARPALGFTLDVSTRADLDAWAAKHGVSCSAIAGNETLQKCLDVPATAVGEDASLGPLEEVTFELSASGELVSVQTTRRRLSAPDAARISAALEASAARALGEPTRGGGAPTAAHLGAGVLRSYLAEHTFTDYRATVSATNLAPTGVMVREQYLSAR